MNRYVALIPLAFIAGTIVGPSSSNAAAGPNNPRCDVVAVASVVNIDSLMPRTGRVVTSTTTRCRYGDGHPKFTTVMTVDKLSPNGNPF